MPAGDRRLLLPHRDDSSLLIEIDAAGGSTHTVWQSRVIRNSYALPVYRDGELYAYSSRTLTCVDAATGESRWRSRAPGDGFPILVDGHLVIQTKQGSLHIVEATPEEYRERAALELFADASWTSPGFSEGAIYARSMSEIARVDLRSGTGEGAGTAGRELVGLDPGHSPLLSDLLKQLEATVSPKDVVDRFMASHPRLPIVEGNTVHFIYRGAAGDVALAGDLPGARQEWPMSRLPGTDLFVRSVSVEPDAAFSYVFMVDFTAITDPGNPESVLSRVYGPELEPVAWGNLTMSWFAMPGWSQPSHLQEVSGRRGKLEQLILASHSLDREVPLCLYLPAGYGEDRQRYPVLYLFGGRGALELGGFPETLDILIANGTVRPVIAVFILLEGTGARRSIAEMVAKELIPFVDSSYQTLAPAEHRACVGMGWAAVTAAYCTLKYPGTAGKLALQSVYALTAPEGGVESWVSSAAEQNLSIYLDWGRYDLRNPVEAWSMAEDNRRLYERFQQRGYRPLGGAVNEGAGWASWRNRSNRWLQALFSAE